MKTLEKIDLYKIHKDQYVTPKKPVLVDTKPAAYLAIEGQGAPGGESFATRIGALYGVAFTVKMSRKFGGQQDYAVCKLESILWTENEGGNFAKTPRDQWRWKLLIRTPEFVTADEVKRAIGKLLDKGKEAAVREVRLETLCEGLCVQMLHVGPYERECESMALMDAFANTKRLVLCGKHHEVYLSDPRRVAPEKLKTILRQPVQKAA